MTGLDVRILSLHWKNIRAMKDLDAPPKKGEVYSDFPSENKGAVLQMPNSSGKTTTLGLLKHVITGVLPTASEALQYRRAIGKEGSGQFIDAPSCFIARFSINEEKWGIELHMNHLNQEVYFVTQTPNKGKRNDWQMPMAFRQTFYNKGRLGELVIFDAETSRKILNRTDTELLRDAIRQFGGYAGAHTLVGSPTAGGVYSGGKFEEIKEGISEEIGKIRGDKGGRQKHMEKCLKAAKVSKKEILKHHTKLEGQLKKVQGEIDELKTKFDDELKGIEAAIIEVKELGDELIVRNAERSDVTQEMLDALLKPQNVLVESWKDFASFHKKHQDEKLPDDVGRGWIKKTAEGNLCICGRPIDEGIREHILSNFEDHLEVGKLHAVAAVQGAFSDTKIADSGPVQMIQTRLNATEDLITELTQKKDISISEGATKEAQEKMKKLQSRLEKLDTKKDELVYGIHIMATTDLVWLRGERESHGLRKNSNEVSEELSDAQKVQNLGIVERMIDHFETRLAEMKGAGGLLKGLTLTRTVIGEALDELNQELRVYVSQKAHGLWKTLPPAQRDRGLDMSIGEDGVRFWRGEERQSGVGGAQGVTACYSITASICQLGDYSVPLVADTPFAGWDNDILPEWEVSVAGLFAQWIVLVNKSETEQFLNHAWNGRFPDVDPYCASMYEYEEEFDSDGGRKLRYTEDAAVFEKMARGD